MRVEEGRDVSATQRATQNDLARQPGARGCNRLRDQPLADFGATKPPLILHTRCWWPESVDVASPQGCWLMCSRGSCQVRRWEDA